MLVKSARTFFLYQGKTLQLPFAETAILFVHVAVTSA